MSVQKRNRNGKIRWVARYRGANGREYSKTFDTKREATAWVTERERELRRGEWINPGDTAITVEQAVTDYIAGILRPNTRRAYEQLRKNLGDLTHMPIGAVKVTDIETWLHALYSGRPWHPQKTALSENTIKNMRGFLSAVFNTQVRLQALRANPIPLARMKLSADRRVDPREIPTAGQVMELARVFREGAPTRHDLDVPAYRKRGLDPSPTLALMVELAAATGMRVGELAGLRAQDLDPDTCTIHVTCQVDSKGRQVPLKTKQSYRSIVIDEDLMARVWKQAAAHPNAGEWVFTNTVGHPFAVAKLMHFAARARTLSGLPDFITWHSLRHFHATTLLSAGVPVKTVQARLGHASAAMTLDVYAHAVPDDAARAVEVITGVLRAAGPVRDGGSGLRAV